MGRKTNKSNDSPVFEESLGSLRGKWVMDKQQWFGTNHRTQGSTKQSSARSAWFQIQYSYDFATREAAKLKC